MSNRSIFKLLPSPLLTALLSHVLLSKLSWDVCAQFYKNHPIPPGFACCCKERLFNDQDVIVEYERAWKYHFANQDCIQQNLERVSWKRERGVPENVKGSSKRGCLELLMKEIKTAFKECQGLSLIVSTKKRIFWELQMRWWHCPNKPGWGFFFFHTPEVMKMGFNGT